LRFFPLRGGLCNQDVNVHFRSGAPFRVGGEFYPPGFLRVGTVFQKAWVNTGLGPTRALRLGTHGDDDRGGVERCCSAGSGSLGPKRLAEQGRDPLSWQDLAVDPGQAAASWTVSGGWFSTFLPMALHRVKGGCGVGGNRDR